MNLTAAKPLLATKTEWTGRSPPKDLMYSSKAAAVSEDRLGTPRRAEPLVLALWEANKSVRHVLKHHGDQNMKDRFAWEGSSSDSPRQTVKGHAEGQRGAVLGRL